MAIWMSHVSYTHESCLIHINQSRLTRAQCLHCSHDSREQTGSLLWSHATHVNDSCHTHEWDISHTFMGRITPTTRSEQTDSSPVLYKWVMYKWVMSHVYCNTLQHAATRCNTLQHTLHHTARWLHDSIYKWVKSHVYKSVASHKGAVLSLFAW